MKNIRKKVERRNEMLVSSKKYAVSVSYSVQQNFNPQDFPPSYLDAGLVIENVFMTTHQTYTVRSQSQEDAESYIRSYIQENLPYANYKYELSIEELNG